MKQALAVVGALLLGGVLPAAPAACQQAESPPPETEKDTRVELFVAGALPLADVAYSQTRSVTEYLETGRFSAEYSTKRSAGFEGGLQVNLNRRLGFAAAVIASSRDATTSYSLEVPHPLYFNQARTAEGSPAGLSYSETSFHLDVVVRGGGRRLGASGFVGVSLVSVKADLLGPPQYSQSYPFDEISVGNVPSSSVSDSPVGFNAGANVDVKLTRAVGVRAQARYVAARAKLAPAEGDTIEIDAGGFHVSLGLRIGF